MNTFHVGSGNITTLQELFVDQLRDLYSAETQLTQALPEMAAAANDPVLKQSFVAHMRETRGHIVRLARIFNLLDEEPAGKTCVTMEVLIQEGKETINEDASPEVQDAALIAAAQRVEHYEIAGYCTVRTYANILGYTEVGTLLQDTLEEECTMNMKLIEAACSLHAFVLPVY